MKKVLIISAGFGDGHNTAARSIRDALELISDDVKVEILDLLGLAYGTWYDLARKTHHKVVQMAPGLWSGMFSLIDQSPLLGKQFGGFARLQERLGTVLHEAQPDCVVSTFPLYSHIIHAMFQDHLERPFRFITVVTDATNVHPAWHSAPSDLYCVVNESAADALRKAAIPGNLLRITGFPVSPAFADRSLPDPLDPHEDGMRRILYIINCGKRKSGRSLDRLMENEKVELTVTVGRDPDLKAELHERAREHGARVRVLGWTNDMARLMRSSHLVIGKAGDATVHEAMAARCPMIINQVLPGHEEGNAEFVTTSNIGTVADGGKAVCEAIDRAFSGHARLWTEWRDNLSKISRPDASIRIAELVLAESNLPAGGRTRLFTSRQRSIMTSSHRRQRIDPAMLLCDFHIHTNYSDGKLTAPEVVDFYGQRGFDCICITDHLADPRRLIGRMSELCNFTLGQDQVGEYFRVLERERNRAWRKYGMILLTGIEFNKDGFTKKSSAHLLGIDLKKPVDPSLNILDLVARIHDQGGLAVASHPHIMESEWGKNTLYLWENQEIYGPVLDAWEIANRNNIFNRVGLKRLPFLANSDFHKPKHIYSWKTLLLCGKDPEEIKDCIRHNRNVAITLYREGMNRAESLDCGEQEIGQDLRPQFEAPLRVA